MSWRRQHVATSPRRPVMVFFVAAELFGCTVHARPVHSRCRQLNSYTPGDDRQQVITAAGITVDKRNITTRHRDPVAYCTPPSTFLSHVCYNPRTNSYRQAPRGPWVTCGPCSCHKITTTLAVHSYNSIALPSSYSLPYLVHTFFLLYPSSDNPLPSLIPFSIPSFTNFSTLATYPPPAPLGQAYWCSRITISVQLKSFKDIILGFSFERCLWPWKPKSSLTALPLPSALSASIWLNPVNRLVPQS